MIDYQLALNPNAKQERAEAVITERKFFGFLKKRKSEAMPWVWCLLLAASRGLFLLLTARKGGRIP